MAPVPLVVVVDANVLFPLTLRDTMLRAASAGYFQLRWSKDILWEMERNLVSTGTMAADKAARLRAVMERYFPEAMVTRYEPLITGLRNDPKDRHVVAVAVKAGAQLVVTSNLRDFVPLPDGVEARSPDEFLRNVFDANASGFLALLREQAHDLRNPPIAFDFLLTRLERAVPKFVAEVRRYGTG